MLRAQLGHGLVEPIHLVASDEERPPQHGILSTPDNRTCCVPHGERPESGNDFVRGPLTATDQKFPTLLAEFDPRLKTLGRADRPPRRPGDLGERLWLVVFDVDV